MEPRKASGPSAQSLINAPRVAPSAPKKFVIVNRDPDIQAQRTQLPILKEEFAVFTISLDC